MASEFRVNYGDAFLKKNEYFKDTAAIFNNRITPTTHGFDLTQTYNHDLVINMSGKIVTEYHFDS